jgi:hypothetical protein
MRSIFAIGTLRRLARAIWPLIAIVVLGAVALAHPNSAWTSAALSAAALLPLGMIVAARYGSEARRPSRNGFAICCGGYFLFFAFFADSAYLENLATSKAINLYYQRLFPNAGYGPIPSSRGGFGGTGFGGGGGGFGGGGGMFDVADTEVAQLEPGKGTFAPEQNTEPAVPVPDSDQAGEVNWTTAGPVAPTAPTTAQLAQSQAQQAMELARASNFWLIGHAWWALLFGWIGACLAHFMASRQAGAGSPGKQSATAPSAVPPA